MSRTGNYWLLPAFSAFIVPKLNEMNIFHSYILVLLHLADIIFIMINIHSSVQFC